MAGTRLASETNARILIGDLDSNNYAVSNERLHEIIKNKAQMISREVGLGPSWSAAAVALTQGTRDYTLGAGVEYSSIRHLILDSRNWIMSRVPLDTINAYYQGFVPFSNAVGIPYVYAMWESSSQTINLRIFPTPASGDSISIFTSVSGTPLSADGSTIPFSNDLLMALEKAVAVAAWKSMPADRKTVSPEFIQELEMDSARGIADERIRLIRLRRTSNMALGAA